MSEQIEDILNTDLTGIDVSRPILLGSVRCKVGTLKTEKKDNGVQNILIPLTTEENARSTKGGDPIPPGFAVTERICVDTPNSNEKFVEMRNVKMKKFQLACGQDGPFAPLERYEGAIVNVRFDVREKDGVEYQDVKGISAVKG